MTGSAKQSISPRKGRMDCFVANAPRNDVVRSRFKQQTHVRLLAAWFARALLGTSVPSKKREQGMPDARCTRGLVCKIVRRTAHEHTGSAEALRHSLRNGFTAYAVLSPATNSSCHRRCRLDGSSIRSDRGRHRQLDTSNGCRDHTVLPYALAPFVLRAGIAHEKLALRHRCAPTLPRPPHPLPRS
ncbi:MAG: hypothetical protein JWQ17_1874 [Tardiphaga sp.]|nr:hypothetical protein [Tardiphaga sp.]